MAASGDGNRLFATLAQYARLYHKPITEEELVHGLPLNVAKKGPELFSCSNLIDNFARAAKRAGLLAKLQERKLSDISELTLPAIIAMKDGSGCILDKVNDDKSEFCIISPDSGDITKWLDKEKL